MYKVIKEDLYITKGFIIYNEEYTQFIKIFKSVSDNTPALTFIISDEYIDKKNEAFRHITLNPSDEVKECFKCLAINNENIYYSINPYEEGFNQLRIKNNDDFTITFTKDLTYNKNLSFNAMRLTVTGNQFYEFYNNLEKIAKEKDEKNKVLEKMINLKATK